jgi:hypothetical protein
MDELIEALTIFKKYQTCKWPTHCEHEVLEIMGVSEEEVSAEDKQRLYVLGFLWDRGECSWVSFIFGCA